MNLSRRAEINLDSGCFFQFGFQTHHGQQTGTRRRVHQQVEVAAVLVVSMKHAAEDARVGHARLKHKLADRLPMLRQYLGWPHGGFLTRSDSSLPPISPVAPGAPGGTRDGPGRWVRRGP